MICGKSEVFEKKGLAGEHEKSPKIAYLNAIFGQIYAKIPHISVRDASASGRTRTYNPSVNSSASSRVLTTFYYYSNPEAASICAEFVIARPFTGKNGSIPADELTLIFYVKVAHRSSMQEYRFIL